MSLYKKTRKWRDNNQKANFKDSYNKVNLGKLKITMAYHSHTLLTLNNNNIKKNSALQR